MKAEHRKELETNVLADKMGHLVQRIKTRPQRRTLLYVVLIVAVMLGLFFFMRMRKMARMAASDSWVYLERNVMDRFLKDQEYKGTNAERAARFQFAWLLMWERGLKSLGANAGGALEVLDYVEVEYRKLAEECKGDPVWEPEARYGIALIEETRAVQNRDKLKSALKLYQDLSRDYPKSAHGQMADKRAKLLEDEASYQQIANFYRDLKQGLKIPEPKAPSGS